MAPAQNIKTLNQYKRKNALSLTALNVLRLLTLCLVLAQALPAQAEGGDEKPAKKGYNREAVARYNQGREFYKTGYFNKAVEAYKQAIALDDRMEQAYCNLGLTYIQQKNYAKAQEALLKAVALKPDRASSLNGLASVLFFRGKKEEAIEKWQEAVKVDPKFASAYLNMGKAMESLDQLDDAQKAFSTALKLQPDLAQAYYSLGLLMLKRNHEGQAHYLLSRAVELEPESEYARDARKQVAALTDKFAKEAKASGEAEEEPMKVVGANIDHELKNHTKAHALSEPNVKVTHDSQKAEKPAKRGFNLLKRKEGKEGKEKAEAVKMKLYHPTGDKSQTDLKARPPVEPGFE